jgi:hypothetical protein
MLPRWSDRATQLSTTESQLLGLRNITKQNIDLENKHAELGEQKRKFQTHGQSATHVPSSTHHRDLSLVLVDQVEIICKILSCKHSTQQFQHFSQQTPHVPNHHRDRLGALMRNNSQVHSNGCFRCGELE